MGEWRPQEKKTPPDSLDWSKICQQVMSNPNVHNSLSLKSTKRSFEAIPDFQIALQNNLESTDQPSAANLLPFLDSFSAKLKRDSGYSSLPASWLENKSSPTTDDEVSFANVQEAYNSLFPPNKVSRQDSEDARSQCNQEASFVKEEASDQSQTSSVKKSNNVRWNSWSHEEEVFLVVSVLDRFFRRGSLASSGKGKVNNDCWAEIKTMYDKICVAWHKQSENIGKPKLINRSTSALCRHFKIMKVRAAASDKKGKKDGNFRKFLKEWDSNFNLNGKLIPEDDESLV